MAWSNMPKSEAPEEKLRCLMILNTVKIMNIALPAVISSFLSLSPDNPRLMIAPVEPEKLSRPIRYLVRNKKNKPKVGPDILVIPANG